MSAAVGFLLLIEWVIVCSKYSNYFNESVEMCFAWYNIKKQVLFVFTRYIDYIVQVIRLLQACDIKPIAVFDGNKLPAKSNVNRCRERYSFNNLNHYISHCDQNISFFILIFSYCICVMYIPTPGYIFPIYSIRFNYFEEICPSQRRGAPFRA